MVTLRIQKPIVMMGVVPVLALHPVSEDVMHFYASNAS